MLRTVQDNIFSKIVRTRDKFTCQRCGTSHQPTNAALHCSHFFSRGKWSTRFDLDNCISLCYGCHRYYDAHKEEYREWKIELLGEKGFEALELRSNKTGNKRYLRSKEHTKELREKLRLMQNG